MSSTSSEKLDKNEKLRRLQMRDVIEKIEATGLVTRVGLGYRRNRLVIGPGRCGLDIASNMITVVQDPWGYNVKPSSSKSCLCGAKIPADSDYCPSCHSSFND
jgi:hypothetical protein